ncbi:MAG: hypothetical protein IJ984_03535, partial [Prevotella sp.]|nr:hypothetical protein [Prevotella sp.]
NSTFFNFADKYIQKQAYWHEKQTLFVENVKKTENNKEKTNKIMLFYFAVCINMYNFAADFE